MLFEVRDARPRSRELGPPGVREVDAGARRASIAETWTTRRTPSRNYLSRLRAPFVVLYFSGCAHLHEVESRATLSVRDSCDRKVVTVDAVVPSDAMESPMSLKGLLTVLMQSARLRTSKGVRNKREMDESYSLALQEWMSEPTTMIHVSVNGTPPRELRTTKEIAIVEGEDAVCVTVDIVLASLPAPGDRTPAQKLWLEPELACAVDAVVRAGRGR